MVFFCISNGERNTFEIRYNSDGKLEGVKDAIKDIKVKDTSTYFGMLSNRHCLEGLQKPISKDVFFDKIKDIPFLYDLIHVETFNTDLIYGHLMKKQILPIQTLVSYHRRGYQLTFDFKIHGEEDHLVEGEKFKKNGPNNFTVEMSSINKEDLFESLRFRIIEAIEVMIHEKNNILPAEMI